jgi:excisionase family DNA binding protein
MRQERHMNFREWSGRRPQLVTVAEAAEALRISDRTVFRWVERGELPVVRLGRRVLLREQDLAAYVDARTVNA